MNGTILWALLTGFVTGGVAGGIWVGNIVRQRQRRLVELQQALIDDTNRRLADLDETYHRLAEVEERLEFTERLLQEQGPTRSLEPPAS